MVIRSRAAPAPASPTTPTYNQLSHDERLAHIDSEVLHNADIPPPSYDDVVVMQARVPGSSSAQVDPAAPVRTVGPAGAASSTADASNSTQSHPDAPYSANSKLAQDLQYYNTQRASSSSSLSAPPQISEKAREAYEDFPDDLSDADSLDSEDWDNATVAGIHTPGTTVHGGDENQDPIHYDHDPPAYFSSDSKSRSLPSEKLPPPQHSRGPIDPTFLERIRERHNLPANRIQWTRDDWRAAKVAYKAEKREARAAWRAEKESRREAWKAERREVKGARRELRQERKDSRDERREEWRERRRDGPSCCRR